MTLLRTGFIGLGSQGGPMARQIARDGHPLTVWARRRDSLRGFEDGFEDGSEDGGAQIAASPAGLGASCDVVGICVMDDTGVADVLLRPDGVLAGMAPGGTIMIHSTVHPGTVRRMADEAAARGVDVLDAPVSGGGAAAADRRLLVMVGGETAVLERCRPVIDSFAGRTVHLGGVGTGQLAKLINNLAFTVLLGVADDTFTLAQEVGMDRQALATVLEHGSGSSRAAAILAASGFDPTALAGAAALLRKDVHLAMDLAGAADPTRVSRLGQAATRTVEAMEAVQRRAT